ncbi:hypothetical protein SODG_002759 [Sodalis praecaptivus]
MKPKIPDWVKRKQTYMNTSTAKDLSAPDAFDEMVIYQ